MALFKRTVRDGNGSIVPLADLYVRNELNSALVTIYSDAAMTTTVTQPLVSDSDGAATFYVPPGVYTLTAQRGGDEWVEVVKVDPQRVYDDASDLISSTEVSRKEGAYWQAQDGLIYRESAPTATDSDVTTAGDVKLDVADDSTSATAVGATDAADPTGRDVFAPALVASMQRRRLYGVTLRDLVGRRYNPVNDAAEEINGFSQELVPEGIGLRDDHNLLISCETALVAYKGLKMTLGPGTQMRKVSSGGTRLMQRDKSRDLRDTSATLAGTAGGSLVVTSAALAGAASPPVVGDKLLIRHCSDAKYYLQGVIAEVTAVSGNNFTLDYRLTETITGITCHATLFAWADDLDISGGIWGAFDDATKSGHLFELFGSSCSLRNMRILGHYNSEAGGGGLAMLLGGDDNTLHNIRSATSAATSGTGGIRVIGGRGWRISQCHVLSGDDALQFVPGSNPALIEYDWDTLDSIYSDCVGYSTFARSAIIAMGGPQEDYSMLARMQGITMRGISGWGTNRSVVVDNSEGIGYAGQVDNILLDDINIDARRENDLTSQSLQVYSRVAGGVGRVSMRKVVTTGTSREHGLTIQAPGAHVTLDDCAMEGQGAAVDITGARRVDIIGGAYGTVDQGGGGSPNHVIDVTVAAGDAELNISRTPRFYGVATDKAALRLSSSTAVARCGEIEVERRSGATGVIGVSHANGAKAALGAVLGDYDTAQSGGGTVSLFGAWRATAAQIADATHAVNADASIKQAGAQVQATDTRARYVCRATGATGIWDLVDGSASVTPS